MSWYLDQILVVVKLSIFNEIQNIRHIIYDAQKLKTVMTGVIGDINSQGWIWMGAKWVTDILSVLTLLVKKNL